MLFLTTIIAVPHRTAGQGLMSAQGSSRSLGSTPATPFWGSRGNFLGKRNRGKSTVCHSSSWCSFGFWFLNRCRDTQTIDILYCTTVIPHSREWSFAYSTISHFLSRPWEHTLWLNKVFSVFQSQPSTAEISSKHKIRLHTKNQQPLISFPDLTCTA